MNIELCKQCGEPSEPDLMSNGVCFDCLDHHPIDWDKLFTEIDGNYEAD